MENEKIKLNYKNNKYGDVPKIDILTIPLMRDRRSVLFVGEANFTFTVAFAAYREYYVPLGDLEKRHYEQHPWYGITSTKYDDPPIDQAMSAMSLEPIPEPGPVLNKVKIQCIKACTDPIHSQGIDPDYLRTLQKIRQITDLPAVPPEFTWKYSVDALQLTADDDREVIWFQCPWSSHFSEVADLVSDFLLNTAEWIEEGHYVCVGITKQFPYVKSYDLKGILGSKLEATDNCTKVLEEYEFYGADVKLIVELLKFGYLHEGNDDIHHKIFQDHLTLVFKRKPRKKAKKAAKK